MRRRNLENRVRKREDASRERTDERREPALSSPAPLSRLSDFNVGSFSEMGRSLACTRSVVDPLLGIPSQASRWILSVFSPATTTPPLARNIPRKFFRSRSADELPVKTTRSRLTHIIFLTIRRDKRNRNISRFFAVIIFKAGNSYLLLSLVGKQARIFVGFKGQIEKNCIINKSL